MNDLITLIIGFVATVVVLLLIMRGIRMLVKPMIVNATKKAIVKENTMPTNTSYPALVIITAILKIYAWVNLIAGVALSLYLITDTYSSEVSIAGGIILLIISLFVTLLSLAVAELITVFVDTSINSKQILNLMVSKNV